jgi:hypothetical protein
MSSLQGSVVSSAGACSAFYTLLAWLGAILECVHRAADLRMITAGDLDFIAYCD